jgi:hypothetical protein
MLTISSKQDLLQMYVSSQLESTITTYLEQQLEALIGQLEPNGQTTEFSLTDHGYLMAFLEPMDSNFILTLLPEYVEIDSLENGTRIYRIGILEDNEAMILMYSIVSSLDILTEEWLSEQSSKEVLR